jgi:aminomuconate-semialdehyde/2-hydroxymuconate-6-semialdehyde dehydrogenase
MTTELKRDENRGVLEIPAHLPEIISINDDDDITEEERRGTIIKNYINGEFRESVSGKKRRYIVNRNPATNEIINYVVCSNAQDVHDAVMSAKRALEPWRKVSVNERSVLLHHIADELEKNREQLATLESMDTGKTWNSAFHVDIARAISNFRFYANEILQAPTLCHPMDKPVRAINYTLRQPVGVCGLIAPWNLPLYLLSWKIAPALACGNTIVAKTSEFTPQTSHYLAQIMDRMKQQQLLPAGVFNLVHGLGAECGGAIVSHPHVDLISFTGGTHTGKLVGSVAGSMLKKLSLECGGKNALLIFDDADMNKAVQIALRASFANTGQVCLCPSRILVHESVHDLFVSQFVQEVRKLKVGDPNDPSTDMGSLISLPHRAKVEYYINLAQKEGGKIECGGKRPDYLPEPFKNGAFLEPTVITGLPIDCRTALEEIFGCVVTVHKFKNDEEAIQMANATDYGLCASVVTTNVNRAHSISARLEVGMVWVNGWLVRDLRVPFGGVKQSGVGREGGHYSLEFYSHDKNVCIVLE